MLMGMTCEQQAARPVGSQCSHSGGGRREDGQQDDGQMAAQCGWNSMKGQGLSVWERYMDRLAQLFFFLISLVY